MERYYTSTPLRKLVIGYTHERDVDCYLKMWKNVSNHSSVVAGLAEISTAEIKTSIRFQLFPLILLSSVPALSSCLCLECFRKEFLVWVKISGGRLKSGELAISVFPRYLFKAHLLYTTVNLRGNIPTPLVQLAQAINRIAKKLDLWPDLDQNSVQSSRLLQQHLLCGWCKSSVYNTCLKNILQSSN